MVKTEICKKIGEFGEGTKRTLIYYLLVDEPTENLPKEFGVGIRIEETTDESYIHHITPNKEKAVHLVDILASNFVTPISLRDVIEDWIET